MAGAKFRLFVLLLVASEDAQNSRTPELLILPFESMTQSLDSLLTMRSYPMQLGALRLKLPRPFLATPPAQRHERCSFGINLS